MGARHPQTAHFAAYLRELKERSGRSYGFLAGRLHVSTSTLHRYCNGAALPADYAPAERLARLCGATPGELTELHRRWLLADAHRAAPAPGPERQPASEPGPAPAPGSAFGQEAGPGAEPAPGRSSGDASSAPSGRRPAPDPEPAPDQRPTPPPAPEPDPVTDPQPKPAPGAGSASEAGSEPESGPGPELRPGPDPESGPEWRRGVRAAVVEVRGVVRRRSSVGVVLAGVLALALLLTSAVLALTRDPGGPSAAPSGGGRAQPGAPEVSTPAPGGSAEPGGPLAPGAADGPAVSGEAGGTEPPGTPRPAGSAPGGPAPDDPGAAPVTVTTRSHVWLAQCDHRYLIDPGRTAPADVPPPPVEQDAPRWAADVGAVHGDRTLLEVTVQGVDSATVVLRDLHVRVVERRDPLPWNAYAMSNGCGGALTPARFAVDLDAPRPQAVPRDGYDGEGEGRALPAERFPFRVSATEPHVLRVTATTTGCDCDWYLELDWSARGRSGTLRVDDHGRPFRTSGTADRPLYGHDHATGNWRVGLLG
ncbi:MULTISPECIES: helix-turn-helix domain-containing protein [Streptomyces]|uniref:helix-turn-helix domain-containing protein n=1 Tax=Streptomyces TaxID=1883 RepID=UPI0022494A4C|nr:helix-turn-helix domain-containing protein [Streptomyces sp. JHD 1]MCX2970594.1 helix-turn-helix domain-containing protein [Streptomyces sp. JHD 1]